MVRAKSNALNIGFKQSKGEYVVVYDADNTPEADALRYLVAEIESDDELGAVIGKFRTRNRNVNLLTRFINIETLSFQWMAQAGRWQLFKLCTIPGTNFIIRRSILDEIGGWDVRAMAEDTELSFRIYGMGVQDQNDAAGGHVGAGAADGEGLVQAAGPLGEGEPLCADQEFPRIVPAEESKDQI